METELRPVAAQLDTEGCSHCTEVCCRCFPLSYSLGELIQMAKEHPNGDAEYVVKNFVYLGNFQFNPIFPWRTISKRVSLPYFSCKNISWDGKCLDYENRPHLCRDYAVTYPADIGCMLKRQYEKSHTTECEHKHYCELLNPREEATAVAIAEPVDYPR